MSSSIMQGPKPYSFFIRPHDTFSRSHTKTRLFSHSKNGFQILKTPVARGELSSFPSVSSPVLSTDDSNVFPVNIPSTDGDDSRAPGDREPGLGYARAGKLVVNASQKSEEKRGFFFFLSRKKHENSAKSKSKKQKGSAIDNHNALGHSITDVDGTRAAREAKRKVGEEKEEMGKEEPSRCTFHSSLPTSSSTMIQRAKTTDGHPREERGDSLPTGGNPLPRYWCVPFLKRDEKNAECRGGSILDLRSRAGDVLAAASTCTLFSHSALESAERSSSIVRSKVSQKNEDVDIIFSPLARVSICNYCRRPRRPTSFVDVRSVGRSTFPRLSEFPREGREECTRSASLEGGLSPAAARVVRGDFFSFTGAASQEGEGRGEGGGEGEEERPEVHCRSLLTAASQSPPCFPLRREKESETRSSLPPISVGTATTAYCYCHGRGLPRREDDETATPSFSDPEEEERWSSEIGWCAEEKKEMQGQFETGVFREVIPPSSIQSPTSFRQDGNFPEQRALTLTSIFSVASAVNSTKRNFSADLRNEENRKKKEKKMDAQKITGTVRRTASAPSIILCTVRRKKRQPAKKKKNHGGLAKNSVKEKESAGGGGKRKRKGLNCGEQGNEKGRESGGKKKRKALTHMEPQNINRGEGADGWQEDPSKEETSSTSGKGDDVSSLVPLTMEALLLLQQQLREKK